MRTTDKTLMPYFNSLKDNKITAHNFIRTRDEAICFNVLEIPQTEYSVLTVAVMHNRKRRAHLDTHSFAVTMNILEEVLENVRIKYGVEDALCLTPVVNRLSNSWYSMLKCHRVFFLPTELVFSVLEELTSASFISQLGSVVSNVSFYVNTSSHHLKIIKMIE